MTVAEGMGVVIEFDTFEVERSPGTGSGCYARLLVYNGYDSGAPLLFAGCGMAVPPPLAATANVVYIKLNMGYGTVISFALQKILF